MSKVLYKSVVAIVVLSGALFLGVRVLKAQDEPQPPLEDKPKPAGVSIPVMNNGNPWDQENESTNGMTADTTPLTGVQTPTLGSPPVLHSYWVPGVQWSGSIQSTGYNQVSNSSWLMNNFFSGTLSLLKVWSGSQLAVNYSAGGFVSSDSTQGNGYYQQAAFAQTFQWKRASIQLLDQFSYLPQSSFGFGAGTGLGIPGSGGTGPVIPGMGNNYVPNQSIYAAFGNRYSNAASVQFTYATSPRGSITASGSYGFLHFLEEGSVDNDATTGTIGYNYVLSREDTIGVFYRFSAFHFSGEPQAYGDHSANIAYGRKLTGRVALQLYGGPSITTFRVPESGTSSTHGENVGANLSYAFDRGGLSASYNHGIFGGSGVLTGSTGDFLNVGGTHKLGRIWTGQLNMGFSHNAPITNIPNTISQSYNTWTVGGGINRALGRNATFAIAYNATITDYGLAGCTGTACGSSGQTFHYVTVNFQWHTRPLVLE